MNNIPNDSPYCKEPFRYKCPYWRFNLNEERSDDEGWVSYQGYCNYYKQWIEYDDDVRLLECLAEWGDDY